MQQEEIKQVAKSIVDEIRADHHDFWIDPESHYQDHMQRKEWKTVDYDDLRSVIKLYTTTRNLVGKAFIGFAIIGLIASIAWGALRGIKLID